MRYLTILLATLALGQQLTEPTGAISGIARDQSTGEPVAEASITASVPGARPISATTDAQGRYSLRDLRPGAIQLSARGPLVQGSGFPALTRKVVTLGPGQTLESIDVLIQTSVQISGTVSDQNDEPVAGIAVYLVSREYMLGELRHIFIGVARTDDQGRYTLQRASPGVAYLVLATKSPGPVDAVSDAPFDPRYRRPAVMPTFYPGVETVEGAQAITLRSGEHRQGVDIRLRRTPSYCAEGVLSADGGPVAFEYLELKPRPGVSSEGGMYVGENNGRTAADGRVRICDLHPGEYRMTVTPAPATGARLPEPAAMGFADFTITDRDGVISVLAVPKMTVPAELTWADGAPATFAAPPNWVPEIRPLRRASPREGTAPAMLAGPFMIENLFADDYRVLLRQVPAGTYLKDIVYGNQSVLRAPFHPGSATGDAVLRIILARDGGTLDTRVVDEEGKALPDQFVIAVPADVRSPADVADRAVSGQTDQNGAWKSQMLAPAKYYVFATRTPFNPTPEVIDRLWTSRNRAKEVDLSSGKTLEVSVTPLP